MLKKVLSWMSKICAIVNQIDTNQSNGGTRFNCPPVENTGYTLHFKNGEIATIFSDGTGIFREGGRGC